ncbi:DoxX family protein [Microcella sp.]|uniref:DoxX family protein n=1 Tax=Microcella sp. TaxID=1913979 RepID=UPI002563A88B|nr:DoxX family membrane protein [Microcella sp.]MBX9472888.1 DoxX family membrane protein [Microcella sp.]
MTSDAPSPGSTWPQRIARWLLGAALLFAGIGHLTYGREEFLAQVPPWLPLDGDFVVVASGVVEIALGLSLLVLGRWRVWVGWATALFFLAIFPGNIAQFTEGRDGFGLDTDLARGIRLLFQPVLVAWALWSTGAWRAWRTWRARRSPAADTSATMEP